LPAQVAAIRNKILWALENDLEALRIPIDWNEMRPLFAKSGSFRAGTDPIEILKAQSFDTKGYEILRILKNISLNLISKSPARPITLFEWPAFRAAQPNAFHPRKNSLKQWSCVRFADLKESEQARSTTRRADWASHLPMEFGIISGVKIKARHGV